jgi:hypothetical protein
VRLKFGVRIVDLAPRFGCARMNWVSGEMWLEVARPQEQAIDLKKAIKIDEHCNPACNATIHSRNLVFELENNYNSLLKSLSSAPPLPWRTSKAKCRT